MLQYVVCVQKIKRAIQFLKALYAQVNSEKDSVPQTSGCFITICQIFSIKLEEIVMAKTLRMKIDKIYKYVSLYIFIYVFTAICINV